MSIRLRAASLFTAACLCTTPAVAVDGVVLITQSKAIGGNVTPGDTAGFPVTLTRPGSYRLASNLFPGADKTGIVAASTDITIDLNGFVMSGGPAGGTSNSLYGIEGLSDRLTVRNGMINAFENAGIKHFGRSYLIVENMRIINNGRGIENETASYTRIQNNTIATNRYYAVACGEHCHVEGNLISGNGTFGVYLRSGSVLDNTITGNGKEGILNSDGGLDVGYGNNTVAENGGASQVRDAQPMHPNFCPTC